MIYWYHKPYFVQAKIIFYNQTSKVFNLEIINKTSDQSTKDTGQNR